MTTTDFVSYVRVSTATQGASGLGQEAQRTAIAEFVKAKGGSLVDEFNEVESGKKSRRPQLLAALASAKQHRATLVIAKLDRLSRNVAFLSALMESGVPFLALDVPLATPFTLHILSAVAEQEARAASERTKAALKAARARGVKLGADARPGCMTPDIQAAAAAAKRSAIAEKYRIIGPLALALRAQGATLGTIALRFEELRVELGRGSRWSASQVSRVLSYQSRPTPAA